MNLVQIACGHRYFSNKIIVHIMKHENDELRLILGNCPAALLNQTDRSGSTLLHYAVFHRNVEITKYLLMVKKMSVNVQNNRGETPLLLAVNNLDCKMVILLRQFDADVSIQNEDGHDAFVQLAMATDRLIAPFKFIGIYIEMLLSHSYDNYVRHNDNIATRLYRRRVPLYDAVLLKNAEITRILIVKFRMNVNQRNINTGETALHIAVQENDFDNVQVLIDHNANINLKDAIDKSPFFNFALKSYNSNQNVKILKILMDYGAEYQVNDLSGVWQCFPILADGCLEVVRLFLQYDVDFHAKDEFNQTLIHYLSKNTIPNIFNEVDGIDFDASASDDEGYTPLHNAIVNPSSLEYLLRKGANINAVTRLKLETPLFTAFTRTDSRNYTKSIQILLQHGADVQTRTRRGANIVDIAIRYKKFKYLKPILAYLALNEDCGRIRIKKHIRKRINSHSLLKKRFNFYRRHLQRLKINKLRGIVTLYDLLIATDRQLARHLRNAKLLITLARFDIKCQMKPNYYTNTLRKRLTDAIQRRKHKEHAIITVGKIIDRTAGLTYRGDCVVAKYIVSFLRDKDIRTLNRALG